MVREYKRCERKRCEVSRAVAEWEKEQKIVA
jgi:hypothetical protein